MPVLSQAKNATTNTRRVENKFTHLQFCHRSKGFEIHNGRHRRASQSGRVRMYERASPLCLDVNTRPRVLPTKERNWFLRIIESEGISNERKIFHDDNRFS